MDAHHSTAQFASIILIPRNDLSISVREYGGQPVYVIEDEISSGFFRIGRAEYTFFSLLDGRTTVADALGRTAALLRENALTEPEAATFCRWLVENGIASTFDSQSSGRVVETRDTIEQRKLKGRLNPVFQKIPLGNPDDWMRRAAVVCGWIFSAPAILIWFLTVMAGVFCVGMRWHDAAAMTQSIISGQNWVWLIGATLILKLLHEMAHGCACRYFNAAVRECGVMLILFVPLPYMDVTSSWRSSSKWHRIMVAAAGMYVELFVAACAAMLWYHTPDALLRQHAFNVMLAAGVVTILFNANPLMRFDGYYILTDLLEMPNLAGHGQTFLLQKSRRWFLGLPASVPTWPEGRTWLIAMYGIAAFAWRIVVCVGMVLAADSMYFGAGIVIAVAAISAWVVMPLYRLLKFVALGTETERPHRLRFVGCVGLLLAAVFAAGKLPWYARIVAPAVVDFDPVATVRASVSGFVDAVHVDGGQYVEVGTALLTLRNDELLAQRSQLVGQVAEAEQKSRVLFEDQSIAAWESELERLQSLQLRLRHVEEELSKLTIAATYAGTVLNADPQALRNTYVDRGEELLSIGDEHDKQVMIMISQTDLESFVNRAGREVDVHLWGEGYSSLSGLLSTPDPRASDAILHPAFASTHGGPLAVRLAEQEPNRNSETDSMRLNSPHVVARVQLSPEFLGSVSAGRTGIVGFRRHQGQVATVVSNHLKRWYVQRQTALLREWRL